MEKMTYPSEGNNIIFNDSVVNGSDFDIWNQISNV